MWPGECQAGTDHQHDWRTAGRGGGGQGGDAPLQPRLHRQDWWLTPPPPAVWERKLESGPLLKVAAIYLSLDKREQRLAFSPAFLQICVNNNCHPFHNCFLLEKEGKTFSNLICSLFKKHFMPQYAGNPFFSSDFHSAVISVSQDHCYSIIQIPLLVKLIWYMSVVELTEFNVKVIPTLMARFVAPVRLAIWCV